MKRKIRLALPAFLLLAVVLAALISVRPVQAHPSSFPDVSETGVAHDAIESLAARGIVTGTVQGDFLPDAPLTRAQATKMLVLWRQVEVGAAAAIPFPDVSHAYGDYVATAAALGWVKGYADGSFGPDNTLTREQMATVIVRSLGIEDVARSLGEQRVSEALRLFTDGIAVSTVARPFVALAILNGVFAGNAGRLDPLAEMTRAQFSLVLDRAGTLAESLAVGAPVVITGNEEVSGSQSLLANRTALAAFMDEKLFQPHNSPITGEMVLQNAEWYGVPPLAQLVILAAETSLGDPKLGGALARSYNFGCMRYHGADTLWGELANGRIWVSGLDWYSFPTPQVGMTAWGRYLKTARDGFYLSVLTGNDADWRNFAAVYYGEGVSGFGSYVDRLHSLEAQFRSMAAKQGVSF